MNSELSGGICESNFRGASEKRREADAEQNSIEKKRKKKDTRANSHMFIDLPWMNKGNTWAANRRQDRQLVPPVRQGQVNVSLLAQVLHCPTYTMYSLKKARENRTEGTSCCSKVFSDSDQHVTSKLYLRRPAMVRV